MMGRKYLALGDSYTIGEAVAADQRWPVQLVDLLNRREFRFDPPEIIATTGWTTDELARALDEALATGLPPAGWGLVTLLIGVNNQYRGRDVENYRGEFEALLRRSIDLADGRRDRVLVVSIPDWGVTPFAEGRDRAAIAAGIDAYNEAHRAVCEAHGVADIDITDLSRQHALLVAEDGLHPSGAMYRLWAERLCDRLGSLR
jgi:lysophospholipase L1-like esterase